MITAGAESGNEICRSDAEISTTVTRIWIVIFKQFHAFPGVSPDLSNYAVA
jgi:hypothetical protein